jgi:pimeloyl-ACP methyl ester carboxylesterase
LRTIYLHGFASGPSSKKARYFQQRFAERGLPLEVPDLNGGDFDHLTISGQLHIIETVARDEPVRLIGSSLGGYLAALYAVRHPEVDRLVLMAPAFNFIARWRERLGSEAMSRWQEQGALAIESYADAKVHRLHYNFIEDGERYEPWPDFKQPAIIFHGRGDDVVPPEYSVEYARLHPNVELRLLESNHELVDVLDQMWRASGLY